MGEIIKQKFNLYNTVGLIDKEKNIYFVPHQADIYAKVTQSRTKVCDCYHELFNEVSPFSSKYQDTEISQWSPEDRVLKIEGIIDDFRQSRGQGLALNYLIITREIYEVEGETETLKSRYYFAMFIDSVEQAGSRAVRLNLSQDYFTTFFYLNNADTLTADYDPFNPIMTNCYVERQHYDRVKFNSDGVPEVGELEKILSSEETFKYKYQYKDKRYPLLLNRTENLYHPTSSNIFDELKSVTTKQQFTSLVTAHPTVIAKIFVSYFNVIFKENCLAPLTLQYDTSRYCIKGGYGKYSDSIYTPFIHTVIPFINIPRELSNIDISWFNGIKCIIEAWTGVSPRPSIDYGYITTSPSDILLKLKENGGSQYVLSAYISKHSQLDKNIDGCSIVNANVDIKFRVLFDRNTATPTLGAGTLVSTTPHLKENAVSFLPINRSGVVYAGGIATTNQAGDTFEPMLVLTSTTLTRNTSTVYYKTSDGTTSTVTNGASDLLFVIGDFNIDELTVNIYDNPYKVDDYYEPLLESDPYTYTTISLNETEQIISKFKLFRNVALAYTDYYKYTMKIKPIITYNESYKVGFIPEYKIDGTNFERYYMDSLVISISSQVPIVDDSWMSYYITNKAQMKNQYAVQENNYKSAQYQNLVSGATGTINATMKGASRGGVVGGVVGAVSGIVDMTGNIVNEEIANKYQVENISLTQSAKQADMGAKPDTVRLAGSDMMYTLLENDMGCHFNHYTIDRVSYNSIAKYLERYGYKVNIMDSLRIFTRVGLNFIKLISFDFVEDEFVLSQEQMDEVTRLFKAGITLLHNKDYLHYLGQTNYHNIELFANIQGGD